MSIANALHLVVAKRTDETGEILSLDLVDPNGETLPAFEAGAHIDMQVNDGLIRQYSLCNSPSERHRYRLGILRAPESRGGSARLHAHLKDGARVAVGRPRNAFRISEDTTFALLVAGGIGITPLMSMAHHLHEAGTPFVLHYCVKSRGHGAFIDELAACAFSHSVKVHFDDGLPEQRLSPSVLSSHPGADLYLCGPAGFMDWITSSALATGFTPARIHSERFSATSVNGEAFTVEAARSGVIVSVGTQQTITDALNAAGIVIPMSCEQGICGTCLTRVISGLPEHRDFYQTNDEKAANTHMTPCCSRSLSDHLVLDL